MAPRLAKFPAPVLEKLTVTDAGEAAPPSAPLKLAQDRLQLVLGSGSQ